MNTAPTITTHPSNATVNAGSNTSFTAAATGTGLTYQWQVNTGSGFTNINNDGVYSNATTETLNITGATAGMSGYLYRVVVTGTGAMTTNSSSASLTVNTAPTITTHPSNATVNAGSNTSFTAAAAGTGLTYQWQVNTGSGFTNITNGGVYSGATTAALNITGATGAMNGYTYQVVVTGTVTPAATSNTATLTVNTAPTITTHPSQESVIVIVNGKEQNAGKETKTTEDGKSTITVEVNNKVIESKIDEAIKNNTTGSGNVIQVPVADTKSEVVKVELTGDIVKKLEENAFDVSVKRDNVEYVIPAEEFMISKVAENLGLQEKDLEDIKVEVKIAKLDEKVVEKYNRVAKANGAQLVFPPVEFEIVVKTTKTDGTTQEQSINKFSNYVERVMEIPAGVDPSKITTGIVFNPDGTYSHVPTEVYQKDGKWYAKLNSLTNSNYSVIWNPVTVKSVEDHWAIDAVNDMASRLIIFNPESFEPNKAVTRADFAEYIVRALGIYREGSTYENKFKDVSSTGERTLAVLIANEYDIVTGYTDGTFRPDQQITREEAMVMYQRAMKITKLAGTDKTRYKSYTDFAKVSTWAENYVKEVLSAHVFNGTSTNTISPKAKLTFAEAAQAIKNLLVESKLINK